MSSLELFLLGPPRIECNGRPLEPQYRKNVALLAYLAVTGECHTREALITLLWPELEPSRARAGLRRNLSVLRKALGAEWLAVDGETVGLNPGAAPSTGRRGGLVEPSGQALWVDVEQFRSLLQAWRGHGHPEAEVCAQCLAGLAEGVELYRGDFLEGFTLPDSPAFDEFQFFHTEGLRQELASALERLIRGHTGRGETERAIPYARRRVALDPLHEPAHQRLMELYAQAGQRAAALRQYEECVRILEAELGLPPSQETASLHEQIRVGAAGRAEPPVAQPRHNLPAQPTPFIGREPVLAEIGARLENPNCRLLTLVGPGGSGKTRLALQTAAARLDEFEHGVFFVPLAPLRSAEAIVPTVAGALNLSFYAAAGEAEVDPWQQLLDYLRQKQMLLVLDNFEHLLNDVGLVTQVLESAPEVKILATSRARLRVQGEHVFPVGGMDFPESAPDPTSEAVVGQARDAGRYSAVKLFLTGARRTRPDFELTADNVADVVGICHLVAGMPLGILLAAAWVGMLTPAEIAAQIGRSLDFLETDLRGVPERQRSMRATFDHSWQLLTEQEREVFQGLCAFRGGFSREAAQAVTGASLRELMGLVDKSLLHRMPTGRYEVHELLRQYGEERLDESPGAGEAAWDRHSAYYAGALERWARDLKGPRQQAALAEMEVEGENARAAWDWAIDQGRVERLDRGIEGLCRFYEWRGRWREGEAACRVAADRLASAEGPAAGKAEGPAPSKVEGSVERTHARAKALAWQGAFSGLLGRHELGGELLRQSLALLEGPEFVDRDTRSEKAFVLFEMGQVIEEFTSEEAKPLYEQSLALYRALGDRWATANVLAQLGWLAWDSATYGEASRLFEESLAIRQSLEDRRGIARSLHAMGDTAVFQGQFEEGERLLRECVALCREVGERPLLAEGLTSLTMPPVWYRGRFAEAYPLLDEAETIYSDLGWRYRLAYCNAYRGWTRMHQGQYERARARAENALTIAREVGHRGLISFALMVLGSTALAEGACAEAHDLFKEAIAADRESGRREELSFGLTELGYAARALGQLSQARQYLSKALQAGAETGFFLLLVDPLPGVALVLADQGEVERAVELYGLASRYPLVANSRWFEDVAGKHIAAVAATLPPEVVTAAQERGRARDLDATVAELLAELDDEE